MPKINLKLHIPTWIGLMAVTAALLYCNLYGLTSGSLQNIGTTAGWPLIYWTELTTVHVRGGMPAGIEVSTQVHWAAIAFNLLAATALLASTGLTIERFIRPGAARQFSLSSIFTLITIVAIALGLRAIEPILFGHGVWSDPGVPTDGDMSDHLDLLPPWPIRVILLLSIAATLLQTVRSVIWLVWVVTHRRMNTADSAKR
jgi:hypothetical protein